MRHLLLSCLLILASAAPALAQDLIHYWNFNEPADPAPAWPTPVAPTYTRGGASLIHTFDPAFLMSYAGTTVNGRDGESSGGSFAPQGGDNQINNGRHFDLHVPSTGYSNITISYATRGTGTGFDVHAISYSLDGAGFQQLEDLPANRTSTWSVSTIDLSQIAGVANNDDLVVRITVNGSTSNSGNNRFDNISVYGFPEGENRPPSFTSVLPNQTIGAGAELSFQYEADDPDGDALGFALQDGPAGAEIDASTGFFTWTPSVDQGDRAHVISVAVSDGSLSASTSATITVESYPDNTPPVFTSALPDTLVRVGDELTHTFAIYDEDGDDLTLDLVAAPEGATLDTVTGAFSWTVTTPGAYRVAVSATDGMRARVAEAIVGVRGLLFGGMEGESLRQTLREHFAPDQVLGYDLARDSMYAALDLGADGFVRGVYTGFGVELTGSGTPRSEMTAGGIDAEHTWPQSKGAGTGNAQSDLHHLFPSKSNVNSARGNLPFGELTPGNTIRWYRDAGSVTTTPSDDLGTYSRLGTQRFQPRDVHAGVAARAILYFFATYESLADLFFLTEQMETVERWSREFAPTPAEVRRTYRISQWQGNVNPFIFDSTLATRMLADVEAPAVTPMEDARLLPDGEPVMLEGIVTRARGRYLRFQDQTGAMTIFQSYGALNSAIASGTVATGDSLRVSGQMTSFNGLRQLGSISTFEVLSRENDLPDPVVLSFDEITSNGEAYESRLIRVEDFRVVADEGATFSASTTYQLTDAEGAPLDVDLRIQQEGDSELVGEPIPDEALAFTGVLGRYNDAFQIEGVYASDIEVYVGSSTPLPARSFEVSAVYPNPASGTTRVDVVSGSPTHLRAELIDVLGRTVRVVMDERIAGGATRALLIDGSSLSSGIYFLRVTTDRSVEQRSLVIVR